MKKMKSIMTLGIFLMSFFVFGLQSAHAQYQASQDAVVTLKQELNSSTEKAAANVQDVASLNSVQNQETRTNRVFMLHVLQNLDGANTTAQAMTDAYDGLITSANGNANRIALINDAQQFVDDLLQ